MSVLYPIAGGAIAVAGADKLIGNRGYASMFKHLGWSRERVQAAAITETMGGLMMMSRSTRRIGGAMVAAVSAIVLLSELEEGDLDLAAPRALVLASGLAAMLAPGG